MLLSYNAGKLGRIEVTEDNTHFLVQIHPGNRERAKKIPGRQWDGNRKAWVYPKDLNTYEALLEEFQNDADSFDIRQPKTKRPPDIKAPDKEPEYNEFEDIEEIPFLEDSGESQGKMYSELEHIRVMLESLKDVAANQSRTLEELRSTQEEATKVLNKFEAPTQQLVETLTVEVLPDNLDLNRPSETELFEKALIIVACSTAGKEKSFCDWVNKHNPLSHPRDFVIETHELLKVQLGKIAGDEDPHTSFTDLVKRIKDEKLIYKENGSIQVIPTLSNLNAIRNRFAHVCGDFNQWERWSRSILYLMNLALIWSKIMIEAEVYYE